MKAPDLAILSISPEIATTRRLLEAAAAEGMDARTIDPTRVVLHIDGGAPLSEDGVRLPVPRAVIPRVGAHLSDWGVALLRGLVGAGSRSSTAPTALALAMDKLATAQRLQAAGFPIVPTLALRESWHAADALDALSALTTSGSMGADSVILKRPLGSQGRQVTWAHDRPSAQATVEVLTADGRCVLVQPLLKTRTPDHESARDLRVLVIGGVAQAACWRHAAPGEMRANIHRGGRSEAAIITDEIRALTEGVAAALDLSVVGVDLLPAPDGFMVLEVNGSPGLTGIEAATGLDLARLWVRHALGLPR